MYIFKRIITKGILSPIPLYTHVPRCIKYFKSKMETVDIWQMGAFIGVGIFFSG